MRLARVSRNGAAPETELLPAAEPASAELFHQATQYSVMRIDKLATEFSKLFVSPAISRRECAPADCVPRVEHLRLQPCPTGALRCAQARESGASRTRAHARWMTRAARFHRRAQGGGCPGTALQALASSSRSACRRAATHSPLGLRRAAIRAICEPEGTGRPPENGGTPHERLALGVTRAGAISPFAQGSSFVTYERRCGVDFACLDPRLPPNESRR